MVDITSIATQIYTKGQIISKRKWHALDVMNLLLLCFSPQTIQIPVLILTVGVDFSLSFQVNNELSFPPEDNSVNPVKLAVEVIL